MMDISIVLTAGAVVGALVTIITTGNKVIKKLAVWAGKYSVNYIRKEDIKDKSFVGQEFQFNDKIAQSLTKISVTMSEMQRSIDKNRVGNLRIELLQLIHNTPDKADIIEQVYDNYVHLGGNSYVRQVMYEWRKIYGQKTIRRHLSHENIEKKTP